MASMAWPACAPFCCVSKASPHMMEDGAFVAKARDAARMVSAGTHVISSAHSGVNCVTCSAI